MIAHFFSLSVLAPKSAMTFDEYRSLGRARNTQRLLTCVRLGSVPPIMVGMPALAIAGEAAWICVLAIGPTMATIPGSLPSLEKASTVPGLVLPLSSVRSSIGRPSTPPALLMSSCASCRPLTVNCPPRPAARSAC